MGNGLNTRHALTKIYSDRLKSFYKKEPIVIEVPSTHGNIVYVVIFCTQHNAAYYMMKQYGIKKYDEWKLLEWARPAREEAQTKKVVRAAEKAGQVQRQLDV
jgi:hypothetical protein